MMVSSLPCQLVESSHLPVRDISPAHFPPQAGGQDHPRLRLKLPQQTEKGRRPREGGLIEPVRPSRKRDPKAWNMFIGDVAGPTTLLGQVRELDFVVPRRIY
jgi:hypothetical protein